MTVKIDGNNGLLNNYDYQVLTTGFSYTFTTYNMLFANPAGTLATGTVTMPASPVDGMVVTISSTQQITALTINANTGQSIVAGGAVQLNANTSRQYMYRLANTTWYLQNITAGNVVTSFNGATGAVTSAYTGVNAQFFTANGTFTIPTGVTAVKVTVIGGGAGGGTSTATNAVFMAGGGGAGGCAIKYLSSLTPGGTLAVTVGTAGGSAAAGNTSSVASGTQTISTISATGGSAGPTGVTSGAAPNYGGAGGTGSGGDINITGGSGAAPGYYAPCSVYYASGAGGAVTQNGDPGLTGYGAFGNEYRGPSSLFGGVGGAGLVMASGGSAGNAATGYGNGGGGAGKTTSATNYAGGAGSGGLVIFEW